MEKLIIIHNIRSSYNVGAILRTAEAFGLKSVIISGYSPYPKIPNDNRLPHIVSKLTNQIKKSSLGAEEMLKIKHYDNPPVEELKKLDYEIIGLEQNKDSIVLSSFRPTKKWALIWGEEVNGIDEKLINQCDPLVEIPMAGRKESFNVSVATGIALYALTI